MLLATRRAAALVGRRASTPRRRPVAAAASAERIESATNALIKRFKRCQRKKHRDAEGLVLVEGARLVADALSHLDAEALL
eukprot:CAMPEP_0119269850 /NCGR_PEP_ID=MMETSP1329-20130426/7090_1 /TAXON_ID=114041 /ORGANISM="Genus nov. species nov., Strain RCC1024" /LENGTH=80 /DNA_ID=CAMNT_0007269851 /DNA_START=201 /DNA_END=440 /DNA_ORIENTATION=-